ncbi:hypothetical protein IL306_014278 [Fusarium sp. DS 682]|nr:hypothetical protein IL306_014278 [Fusarium sp. DS 682]
MSPPLPDNVGDALVKAFSNATGNLIKQVNVTDDKGTAAGQKKPRFIIQSHRYLSNLWSNALLRIINSDSLLCFADIKAYVAAGLAFPKDAATFGGLHPKDGLKQLNDLDVNIYQELSQTSGITPDVDPPKIE